MPELGDAGREKLRKRERKKKNPGNFFSADWAVRFYSLKHYHPKTYNEVYLKPHKKNLKYLNMPPCPVATSVSWYRDFVNQGGLLMTDGNTLPTLNELWEKNKDWKP